MYWFDTNMFACITNDIKMLNAHFQVKVFKNVSKLFIILFSSLSHSFKIKRKSLIGPVFVDWSGLVVRTNKLNFRTKKLGLIFNGYVISCMPFSSLVSKRLKYIANTCLANWDLIHINWKFQLTYILPDYTD